MVNHDSFKVSRKHHRSHVAHGRSRCSNSNPEACIAAAAGVYHQSVSEADQTAECESTMNPEAANGKGDDGLFQILYPSTWEANDNPYRFHSVFSARYNALTAMWMWSRGERGQWQCQ